MTIPHDEATGHTLSNQTSNGITKESALHSSTSILNGVSNSATNGSTNGAVNDNHKEQSSYTPSSENHDYWARRIGELDERCDFSEQASNPTKFQVALSNGDYQVLDETEKAKLIDDDLYLSLKASCKMHNIPLHCAVLFTIHKMLNVFGNGNDTVTATAGFGTNVVNSTSILGRALPVIVEHHKYEMLSCIEAIRDIEAAITHGSNSDRHLDFMQIKRPSLFDMLCIFANRDAIDVDWKAPVLIIVQEHKASLILTIRYVDELFTEAAIDGFLSVVEALLYQIAENPARLVKELEFLSLSQKQKLEEWNRTDGDYPSAKRLNQLVEEAVERTPNHVAIVYKDIEITYRELNECSNGLAHHLITSVGVRIEQIIGLFLDKSELMIITVLGIWKAGATYTPVDPGYPDEKMRFTLEDTQAKIVISNQCHASRLKKDISPDLGISIIQIEPLLNSLRSNNSTPCGNPALPLYSHQLAYVTYTSGTTGIPKGIFKEHRSVVNSITDLTDRYEVRGKREAILLFSAYVFEPFVRQTLMALINSQLLAIIDDNDKMDLQMLPAFVKKHGITYLNGTASVLQEFDFSSCPTLQRMLLVGEDLTESRYMELRRRFKHRIINEYGFTESAFVTALKIFDLESERQDRSLGKPLRNVKCYVLDKNLKQVPIGATGELHIGGLGVARGYMNRQKLTNEKFIPNPYQTESDKQQGLNSQIYKTGDLARWLPAGEVEYLGRNDFQVKLRGIRIEPGEVEAVLSLYP